MGSACVYRRGKRLMADIDAVSSGGSMGDARRQNRVTPSPATARRLPEFSGCDRQPVSSSKPRENRDVFGSYTLQSLYAPNIGPKRGRPPSRHGGYDKPRPMTAGCWYSRLNDTHLQCLPVRRFSPPRCDHPTQRLFMFRRHVIDGWDQILGNNQDMRRRLR